MKKTNLLLLFLLFSVLAYSQCPPMVGPNATGARFILTYDSTADRDAAAGQIESIVVNGVTYTVSAQGNVLLRTPTAGSGFFNGTEMGMLTVTINLVGGGTLDCDYVDGVLVVVPVEYASFNIRGDNRDAILNWSTAFELNNNYFEVLRSDNNGDFTTVGMVEGLGNSNKIEEYSFTDTDLKDAQYFYRLKQVDFDGRFEYSDAVSIRMSNGKDHRLYPTVLQSGQVLNIESPDDSEVQIFSPNMKVINLERIGQSTYDTSLLGKGIYTVVYNNGLAKRFVISQ